MLSQYEIVTEKKSNRGPQTNAYKLIRKLGEGNYATVYLAEFYDINNLKNPVQIMACKVIDTAKQPPEFLSKFLPRELEILRHISHPHIIQTFSVYQKNTRYLIFMRFAENGDLLEFVKKAGNVEENQVRLWTKQIALAVQYLHELEIAHRDLKCENILITANLNAKLTDFGFAKYVLSKTGIRSLSKTFCGSISYSPPEIVKGIPYNPKISDLWSLGVVIYVMLNKALPFNDSSLKKLYDQQMQKKWKFRAQVEGSTSKQVKHLIGHLLEPNPQERYTISDVLSSSWMYMDLRVVGMNEEEHRALMDAKEERKRMEELMFSDRSQMQKEKSPNRKNFEKRHQS